MIIFKVDIKFNITCINLRDYVAKVFFKYKNYIIMILKILIFTVLTIVLSALGFISYTKESKKKDKDCGC